MVGKSCEGVRWTPRVHTHQRLVVTVPTTKTFFLGLVLRVPAIELVMVVGKRDEVFSPGFAVGTSEFFVDQVIDSAVQKRACPPTAA
jgi:hypothetical protein